MTQPYKPFRRIRSEKAERNLNEDNLFWSRLKQLAVFQETSNITSTNICPNEPYYLASTSSVRLSLYDTTVCVPVYTYSRFKEAVFGVNFRKDGKLFALGGQEGKVCLFDAQRCTFGSTGPKAPLRHYKSHTVPVHVVLFTASGKEIIVMGDDGTIKIFDISEMKSLPKKVFQGVHKDHIRCGYASSASDHLFVSGSYDHTAKIWDSRNEDNEPMITVEHGFPIEKVLLLPGDALLVTAAGQTLKIWDVTSGGKVLQILHKHHKTVTSLCLTCNNTRLLTGGLDRRIHVYTLNSGNFTLIYSFKMPAPVHSLAISPNGQCMAVGMSNLLGIFRRDWSRQNEMTLAEAKKLGAGLEYQRQIRTAAPPTKQSQRGGIREEVEITAPTSAKLQLGKIDVLLRQYKHWKAVDVMFRDYHYAANKQDVVVAALREIYDRRALHVALAGRNAETLRPILTFLSRYLFKPDYFSVLIIVANTLLDVYAEESIDPKLIKLFLKLSEAVSRELVMQRTLHQASGSLEVLFATARERVDDLRVAENEVFGDVIIFPIRFGSDNETQADKFIS